MELTFTEQESAFQDEVRAFLAAKLPAWLSSKVATGEHLSKADMELWHSILNSRGWLASHWPEKFGGPGWTAFQKFIFDNECALAHAPRILPFGLNMLGPVLIKFGNAAQQQHWLPRILNGEDWWCQGYSEPGAGSDLAAVKTTAVRGVDDRGEHFIVNGQKTWTTLGQHANMIFALVRTNRDAKKQAGISFLLIDMATPGIEVRPIITLEGAHEVNEVFFTDVRVPVENLVGELDKGWTCAKYLLTYERTNIAGVGLAVAALARLKEFASRQLKNGRPIDEDPLFAARLAKVEIALENMKTTNLRVVAAVEGGGAPGAESSMLKVLGSEIRQEILSLYRRAVGPLARVQRPKNADGDRVLQPEGTEAAAQYLNNRKLSIYGGSNEIQKNIISKTMLGL